ncbi:hypothetical protein BC827DRAFT_1266030 [Russula dissimulans]|nr:hypothetical protein BC827DRAFT_1266030 [Russula dissimulans]
MTDDPSQTLQSFVFDERDRGRFTHEAWRETIRRAWRNGGDTQQLSIAFQYIAEMRGSEALWKKRSFAQSEPFASRQYDRSPIATAVSHLDRYFRDTSATLESIPRFVPSFLLHSRKVTLILFLPLELRLLDPRQYFLLLPRVPQTKARALNVDRLYMYQQPPASGYPD